MDKTDRKLILESLDWIMINTTPINCIQSREGEELRGRINDTLNQGENNE